MNAPNLTIQKPIIVKYVAYQQSGIQLHNLRRHCIGFVVSGKKYIYTGDSRNEIGTGEVFSLNVGNHYIEDIPDNDKPFKQIVFYYTPAELGKVIPNLILNFGVNIVNDYQLKESKNLNYDICHDTGRLGSFFRTIDQAISEEMFRDDPIAENIKMTELVYLIVSRLGCCLKNRLLNNMDSVKENFEQIIHANIFHDIAIEELAKQCNKSLTSFKKDFKKQFGDSPHKWFIRQRLMYARLQLISTSKSIAEIGIECNFPNTSHFIKLFKKQFGETPAIYRRLYVQKEPKTSQTKYTNSMVTA